MKKLIAIFTVFCLASCGGGGTNNDQGVAFTLVGYRNECDGEFEPNLSGLSVALGGTTEPGSFAGGVVAGLVLHNNLTAQTLRAENAFFTYYIPGATVQPPATSSVAGLVIGRATEGTDDEPGEPGEGCIGTFIVPAEVRQWLNLNKNFLPEPPYTMEIRGFVTGISSAGDRFDSNEVKIFVQIVPDIVITPGTEGEDAGAIAEGEAGDTAATPELDDSVDDDSQL